MTTIMQHLDELAEELRIVIGQLRRKLREHSTPETLTWSQLSVIGHLSRHQVMTVTELAKIEGVKSQSMGATLNQLHHQGLVRFDKDNDDGRKKYFSLTTAGIQTLEKNRAQRDDWLITAIQSSFSDEEQHTLISSVELLQRLANHPN